MSRPSDGQPVRLDTTLPFKPSWIGDTGSFHPWQRHSEVNLGFGAVRVGDLPVAQRMGVRPEPLQPFFPFCVTIQGRICVGNVYPVPFSRSQEAVRP